MSGREVTLPDGSTALVEPSGTNGATISRSVDGRRVWGQCFLWSPYGPTGQPDPGRRDKEVCAIIARMTADPDAFHRWWLR